MEYLEQNEIQIRFLRFNLVLGTTEATTKVNSLGLQNTTWDTGKTFSFSMREFFFLLVKGRSLFVARPIAGWMINGFSLVQCTS